MKAILAFCFLAASAVAATDNPVSVLLTSPTNGSTVSGTITLTATASSTMGPIERVEFYCDGKLIGTAYRHPRAPQALKTFK